MNVMARWGSNPRPSDQKLFDHCLQSSIDGHGKANLTLQAIFRATTVGSSAQVGVRMDAPSEAAERIAGITQRVLMTLPQD